MPDQLVGDGFVLPEPDHRGFNKKKHHAEHQRDSSLAAYSLPHPCLRLTPAVTGSRLKTRYEMGWVGPFSVALSATSEPAPRDALTC